MQKSRNNKPNSLTVLQIIRRAIFAITIFMLLGLFQLLILVIPFHVYARKLDKKYTIDANHVDNRLASGYSRLIGRMVTNIAKITPWPSKCLVQALTVKFLLRKLRISSEMFIGVAIDDEQKFSAHTWVNVGEFTVVGGVNSADKFKVMKIFKDTYDC